MTVMNSSAMDNASEEERIAIEEAEKEEKEEKVYKAEKAEESADDEKEDGIFSGENLAKESDIDEKPPMKISPEDKIAFLDSIIENKRFTKDYSLFGGKLKLKLRSLTSDEVNALGAWAARQGTKDSSGLMAGRYRKYLMAAHVEMLDGVEMPPLEEPLFETLEGGRSVQPGWVGRCSYYDRLGFGKFNAIMSCIEKFDTLYSLLCRKAEDENFWDPDTP